MARIRPKKLNRGSLIGLVAPAFTFQRELFDQGRKILESSHHLQLVSRDDVFVQNHYFAGNDERRADEFIEFLTHEDIAGVFAIRGGYGCSRIVERVINELKKFKKRYPKNFRPKTVLGYSDLTIFLNALYQEFGWTTYHGPVMTGRALREPKSIEQETFRKSLFEQKPLGIIQSPTMKTLAQGSAEGPIVGGCLSLIAASVGTKYEVKTKNKVLFLEDVDERPYRVDRMLTQIFHAGLLDHVKAIVFGEMASCEPAPPDRDPSQTTVHESIASALEPLLRKRKIPVILDFPAGHGSTQITFPIGAKVRVDTTKGKPSVTFLEA